MVTSNATLAVRFVRRRFGTALVALLALFALMALLASLPMVHAAFGVDVADALDQGVLAPKAPVTKALLVCALIAQTGCALSVGLAFRQRECSRLARTSSLRRWARVALTMTRRHVRRFARARCDEEPPDTYRASAYRVDSAPWNRASRLQGVFCSQMPVSSDTCLGVLPGATS